MNKESAHSIYFFAWSILNLIDKGEVILPQEVVDEVIRGDIYQFIKEKFGDNVYKGYNIDKECVNRFFSSSCIPDGTEYMAEKFEIDNNGLLMLVKYAIQEMYIRIRF